MNILSEEDAKTLKLFSYYVQSHGCGEINYHWDVGSGGDWDNSWRDSDCFCSDGQRIELYEKIENLFKKIIEENDLADNIDYDFNGHLNFNVDCKERIIRIRASQEVMSSKSSGDEVDSETLKEDNKYEIFSKVFSEMKEAGVSNGIVDFNGSGDSGDINQTLESKNFNLDLEDDVMDYLYRWLERFYGGWEINEGSQGSFNFDSELEKIELHFEENYYENESLGEVFYAKF